MSSIITHEALYEILTKEKTRQDLQKIDPDFFSQLSSYLEEKELILKSQKEKDSFFLAAEVKQWQAHAARLETELKRIRNEADEASGRNDDCVDFACGLSKDIDSIFSAAPAAWRKEEQ